MTRSHLHTHALRGVDATAWPVAPHPLLQGQHWATLKDLRGEPVDFTSPGLNARPLPASLLRRLRALPTEVCRPGSATVERNPT